MYLAFSRGDISMTPFEISTCERPRLRAISRKASKRPWRMASSSRVPPKHTGSPASWYTLIFSMTFCVTYPVPQPSFTMSMNSELVASMSAIS
jgi:hypothetical protein